MYNIFIFAKTRRHVKKIDLSAKLTKKQTAIAIICVAIFVIAGVIGAAVGGVAYYKNQKAAVTNCSSSSANAFHMRANGTLVYVYDNGTENVDLTKIIEVSDGASMSLVAVLDGNKEKTENKSFLLNVEKGETYYVIFNVTSRGGQRTNGYMAEVVNRNNYSENDTLTIGFDVSEYVKDNN